MEQKKAFEKTKLLYPQFEHADDDRKGESPKEAVPGDTVLLKVQTKELANGEDTTFNIFDVSGGAKTAADTTSNCAQKLSAFSRIQENRRSTRRS